MWDDNILKKKIFHSFKKILKKREFQLFLLFFSLYFLLSRTAICSNDGSHYALVKSIVDDHSFAINNHISYTKMVDVSYYNGNFYSDRPPGTAFLAVPFYVVFGNPVLISVISAALSVVLIYKISKFFGRSERSALLISLIFAVGTLNLTYGTILFSHALSAFLILLGVYIALKIKKENKNMTKLIAGLGLVLGYSILVEYTNILPVIIILFYVLVSKRATIESFLNSRVTPIFLICFMIPIVVLMIYQLLCFGGPFNTSYSRHLTMPWAQSLSSTFVVPLSTGVPGLLFFSNEGMGLLFFTPILIFSFWGLYYFFKDRKSEAVLFLLIFLSLFLLMGTHRTFFGGETRDIRYIFTVVPLILFPLVYWIDEFYLRITSFFRKLLFSSVFWSLFALSVIICVFWTINLFNGPHGLIWWFGSPGSKVIDLISPNVPSYVFYLLIILALTVVLCIVRDRVKKIKQSLGFGYSL